MRKTMSVTLGLILALLLVIVGFLAKYWKPSTFPGPRRLPIFGTVLSLVGITSKDVIPCLMAQIKKYGDPFELQIFTTKFVFLSEPEIVKVVLSSSTNISKGGFEYSFLKLMLNDGLIVSDGDKWRTRRKLLTPSFHYKILESSIETVGQKAEEFVSHLLTNEGKPTDIGEMIYLLTLKVICETAMGVKLNPGDKLHNDYIKACKICHDSIVHRYLNFWLFPEFIYRHTKAGKTFFKSADIIHSLADEVIKHRKELFIAEKNVKNKDPTKKERTAFLDILLELVDSNPDVFSESIIREEVDTFLIAGHNPSASALKFLHFLLANHPDVQEKVYDEQMKIFGDDKRMPTAQDLQKMIYLEMVIKETLRLYPAVPFHSRSLNEDIRIDEKTVIPAGCTVAIFTYGVHRSIKYWDDPEEFIPERFAPGIERHPFSFLPFSAGPRNCIGQKYAMMELKTIMSTVVRHCWIEPVTTSVNLEYSITLNPVEPIIVKISPRNGIGRMVFKNNN